MIKTKINQPKNMTQNLKICRCNVLINFSFADEDPAGNFSFNYKI